MSTAFNDLGFTEQLVPKFLNDKTIIKDIAKIKTLYVQVTSANPFGVPKSGDTPNSGAGYQVPSGKKFICFGARSVYNGTGGGGYVHVGTTESDVGFSSGSGGTNAQYTQVGLIGNTSGAYDMSFFSTVPEGKYFLYTAALGSASSYGSIYGFEIDADATSI